MKKRFDIIVIGAGAGGLVVAIGGAKAGKKVLLIEKGAYGGDCTNYGCIPSKSLIASANQAHALSRCQELGIESSPFSFDATGVLDRVRKIISEVRMREDASTLNSFGVETLDGAALFQDGQTLSVGSERVRGRDIVIATGSYPVIPNIPGLEGTPFLTNETVFDLKKIPKSIIFIGGGPIGCELAQAFARLGSSVTLVVRKPYIMNREDADARQVVMERFQKEGINLLMECTTERIFYENSFEVEVRGKAVQRLQAEQLFIGAGRRPHIQELNLAAAGVKFSEEGVQTDAYGRTSNKHIWAVGDAAGPPFFTHYAENQGRTVLKNLLLPFYFKKSRQPIPRCTFTDPEVASIGVMESECDRSKVAIYTVPFKEVDRNITSGRTEGFVKIITKKWSSQILGATIVGPRAGEMLMQISTAMLAKMPLRKFSNLMHPYPIESLAIRKAADKWLTQTILPKFRK
ncbi:MAG: Mercuric reductase [Chlamydiae bacterium]|nr:Mercuric reductase [Chlamydiota bacterium]